MIDVTCSLCGLSRYVKNGFVRWKRRYKCKVCWNNFLEERKKRISLYQKVDILERYMKWEKITSISKSFEGYTIQWVWKQINLLREKIINFEEIMRKINDIHHYFNIVEMKTYQRIIEKGGVWSGYCVLNGKYWLIISPNRYPNSYLKETIKTNNVNSYEEFCIKYGIIFKD